MRAPPENANGACRGAAAEELPNQSSEDLNIEFPADFQLKEIAERIRGLIASSAADMLAIGDELIRVKKHLEHGQFGLWLKSEFGWTARTAQNFMAAAVAFGPNAKSVSYLPVTTLYRLAAPSRAVAREKVIERIESGERLPIKEIDAICYEIRERQKQDRLTAKIKASNRRRPRANITSTSPKPDSWINQAREQYAGLVAKLNVVDIAIEMETLKARVGELRGITAPKSFVPPDPFPELPDFLDRRRK